MDTLNTLWVEKYRPSVLSDLIVSKNITDYFEEVKKTQDVSNLLLCGGPGIGKTTLARIIVQNLLTECQYLYINASDENGIDTIRTKVVGFAQTQGLFGGLKVVILDEGDGLSPDAQRALRNTMEEYSAQTRFIITANYKHRIIPALQSRTMSFDLVPSKNDIAKRLLQILKKEKIKLSDKSNTSIVTIVKTHYPDIRRMINIVQKCSKTGEFIFDGTVSMETFTEEVHNVFEKQGPLSLRKFLIENDSAFHGDYATLLKNYLNYVYSLDIDEQKKINVIATIGDFLYQDVFVVDKEINTFCCFCKLHQLKSS